jgi:hypothetical protein
MRTVTICHCRSHNLRASSKGFLLFMVAISLPLAVIFNFATSFVSDKLILDLVGKTGADYLHIGLVSFAFAREY